MRRCDRHGHLYAYETSTVPELRGAYPSNCSDGEETDDPTKFARSPQEIGEHWIEGSCTDHARVGDVHAVDENERGPSRHARPTLGRTNEHLLLDAAVLTEAPKSKLTRCVKQRFE